MKIIKSPIKKRKTTNSEVYTDSVPRTAGSFFHDMTFSGCGFPEISLYESLRKSLPVLDGAIGKIVRLTGGYRVECPVKRNEKYLSDFLESVCVGGSSSGAGSFTDIYLDQLLTYGTAVGEMVLSTDCRTFALYNAQLDGISLERNRKNPMDVLVCSSENGISIPVKNQDLLMLSVLDPVAGQIRGNSLLQGLPFVSAILLQIFESIGKNWERFGNLRYAVTYKPQNDAMDKAYAKDRAAQIAACWGETMKSGGNVKDFIAVGDVDIRVIGGDCNSPDSEIPVRQLMEQIVAKTGLPPFMLGLNWSTSERMAQQQTDLLTSELWHYRRILTPVIIKICKTFLRMNGLDEECTVVWDDISLMDETEQAKAKYYNAQADKYTAEAITIERQNKIDE